MTDRPYAIIILNQPINNNALSPLINAATYLVCADGGANRLLAMEQNNSASARIPDVIIGDLDSLDQVTEQHYRDKGVLIIKDPDQYSTDFTKGLKWIRSCCKDSGAEQSAIDVVVLGGLGGRVDQGFSLIHHMYMAQQKDELLCGRMYLLSEQSLTFVLNEGSNQIVIEPDTFEENVGIIPVLGSTRISTKGLEWDVEDWLTEFGGQVSTSNHLRSDSILVNVNGKQPLMTLELAKRFCVSS